MEVFCNRKCFVGGRIYQEGERVSFPETIKISRHFTPATVQIPEIKLPIDETSGSIDKLRLELDGLGKAYDRRWGIDKLELEIQKAKKGM